MTASVHGTTSRYWTVEWETAPRERLLERQNQLLREQTVWVASRSTYWRDVFRAAGVDPATVQTPEDLASLPFLDKTTLADRYRTDPPYGGFLCELESSILARGATIWRTTGPGGQALRFLCSNDEFQAHNGESCARLLWTAGCRPGDVLLLCLPVGVWLAGLGLYHAARDLVGITVIPAGPPADTDMRIQFLREYRPTVVVATPSYYLHMAERGGSQWEIPKETRVLVTCGEILSSTLRREIEERWQRVGSTRNFTGLSEACAHLAAECEAQNGMHAFEDLYLFEILEPEGKALTPPGRIGELVLTALTQKAMATAFRYRTGDLVIYDDQACGCGRTTRRIHIVGRTDEMRKIRGINIFPAGIEAILREVESFGPGVRLILVREGKLDRVAVQVERRPQDDEARVQPLVTELERRLFLAFGLHMSVETVAPGCLAPPETPGSAWTIREESSA